MVRISTAETKDHVVIRKLAQQIWPFTFKDILSLQQIEYMLEMMYSPSALLEQTQVKGHQFLLGYLGNDHLGFASYENHYKASTATKIHKLYILPTYQGRGIGRNFLNVMQDAAAAAGDQSILLNVNKKNKAVLFYQKNDFEIISEEVIPIGNGFVMDDYVMEKIL